MFKINNYINCLESSKRLLYQRSIYNNVKLGCPDSTYFKFWYGNEECGCSQIYVSSDFKEVEIKYDKNNKISSILIYYDTVNDPIIIYILSWNILKIIVYYFN